MFTAPPASRLLPSISIPQCLRVAAGAALCAGVSTTLSAQSTATPLRTRPTEKFAVSNGNRDWGPASVAGNLIIAGGPSGAAGLHAVDMTTGKLRWSYRPTDINGSVSTPPAIVRDLAIAPYGAANPGAVIAVSLTTGKPVWRGPDPATNAAVVASSDMVFVPTKDGSFVALDAATGKEIWRLAFSRRRFCVSRPIVLDGVVYVSGGVDAVAGDASRPEGIDLIALDAKTGQQRWRARADAEYGTAGVCLTTPIATATTIYGAAEARLYAFDRTTGRAKWKPVETQVMSDGRLRGTAVAALTDAGNVLVGVAETAVMGFDKNSGKSLWTVPGTFNLSSPSIAVAGNVLYVQGSVASSPAASARGTLNAIDLDSRTVLWSFSRVTAEQNWSFGFVTPVSDGLWVDSYKALVKLVP